MGSIVGGPLAADGQTWWQVDFDNAPDGWVEEDSLSTAIVRTVGDCASETGLVGRRDIALCEPFETSDWWQTKGYIDDARNAPTATTVANTQIVSSPCVSGSCLAVNMLRGQTKALSVKWPLSAAGLAPQQLYLRYYLRLGSNWNPYQCDANGTIVGHGGKFPGLADERISSDSAGQCGNGGEVGDGINCWSMRANFRDCHSGDGSACRTKPGAITRFGSYLYFYRQQFGDGSYTGVTGHWDDHPWGQFTGDGGTCQSTPNNVYCGIGDGGVLLKDRWYLIEMFVKMNMPGSADGIIRGWVDGVLSFEKKNMIFRIPGHDNLHVRTLWLNLYKGGVNGNCADHPIYLDQLVAATDAPIGPVGWRTDVQPPAAPTNLRVLQ